MDTDAAVIDDNEHHRFYVHGEPGEPDAELTYQLDDGNLVLVHTEVPEAFRGRGIGGQLVKAAVHRAIRTGEVIVPRCEFARQWLRDHGDTTEGLPIAWSAAA